MEFSGSSNSLQNENLENCANCGILANTLNGTNVKLVDCEHRLEQLQVELDKQDCSKCETLQKKLSDKNAEISVSNKRFEIDPASCMNCAMLKEKLQEQDVIIVDCQNRLKSLQQPCSNCVSCEKNLLREKKNLQLEMNKTGN